MVKYINVCKVASDSYRSSGSQGSDGRKQTTQTFTQEFLVKALKNRRGDAYDGNPEEISPASIACNSLLPVVNKTAFYDAASGIIHPYAICTSKDIKRRSDNPLFFDVSCSYTTSPGDTEDCSIMTKYVNTPQDLPVQVTAAVSGKDFVLYSDHSPGGDQCWKFEEVDEQYPTPVVTQRPFLTLNIQQYELYLSYQDMMDRSFVVNASTWKGQSARKWRCQVVNVSEIDVQTQAGVQTWAKVSYQVILGNDGYYTATNNWEDIGWDVAIPGLSSTYKSAAGNIEYFVHPNTNIRKIGMIEPDGPNEGDAYFGSRPLYKEHQRYESVNFDTFLQSF